MPVVGSSHVDAGPGQGKGEEEEPGKAVPEAVGPVRLDGRSRLVLSVLLVAQFMLAVDFSILNVALPVIGAGLGFSLSGLQWIATAFALSAAGFTLLFGRIADLFGRRRIFLAGLAVLGLSSLAGGLATGPEMLLTARVFQGLATAAVTPAGLSRIGNMLVIVGFMVTATTGLPDASRAWPPASPR